VTGYLFDDRRFQGTERSRRKPVETVPVETVPVETDSVWKVVLAVTPGVVHAVASGPNGSGAFVTRCGAVGGARTFEPGSTVHGCLACYQTGRRVVSEHVRVQAMWDDDTDTWSIFADPDPIHDPGGGWRQLSVPTAEWALVAAAWATIDEHERRWLERAGLDPDAGCTVDVCDADPDGFVGCCYRCGWPANGHRPRGPQ
jgi:hypothetical protein